MHNAKFSNYKVKLLLILSLFFTSFAIAKLAYGFADSKTNGAVKILNRGKSECNSLPEEYKLDCLQQVFKRAASPLQGPDYSKARGNLSGASRKMKALVSQNVDREKPVIKKGVRKYRAVKKAAVKKVNTQAKKVIVETSTKLFRSASSGTRQIHYQRIAVAVDSTKVILRS